MNRTINVAVSPRMVRASDGQVVYSMQRAAAPNSRWCQDQQRNTNDDAMIVGAFADIAVAIRRDIAPYNAVLNATVRESKEGLPREAGVQFDQAVAAVNANNVNGACQIWGEINTANPNHVWTVYNLGICAEATGDYPGALRNYQMAQQLGAGSDRAVSDSVARVSRLMSAEQQLAAEEAREREAAQAVARRAAEESRRAEITRNARRTELTARHGARIAEAILARQVLVNMTQEQVLASRGEPTRRETLTPTDAMWHYGGERVVFANGRVTFIRR